MRWWELFRQAMEGAARARLRSTLTALGIAIGCGALVSMIAFVLGLQHEMEAPLKRLGMLNDIHVSARSDDDEEEDDDDDEANRDDGEREPSEGDGAPATTGAPSVHPVLDAAAIEEFRKIDGVKYAYADMTLHGAKVARGESSAEVFALALPREAAMIDFVGELITAGEFFSLDDEPEVILAEGILEDLKFQSAQAAMGKTVDVSAAGLAATDKGGEFQFERKTVTVRVVGVFKPPDLGPMGRRFGDRTIILPTDVIQQLPGLVESKLWRMRRQGNVALDAYERVTVRAENPAVVPRVAKAIEVRGFRAHTVIAQVEDMRIAFLFIEALLAAVGSVALLIAGLGIANTLLMTVLERYEEIGLYKAIGATDGDVRLMFIAEAAVLGLVGSLAGLVLAAAVCWALQWGITAYLESEGVEKSVDVFYFPWWLLAGGVGFSTLLAILSGLYPASRAARVDPIRALRRA